MAAFVQIHQLIGASGDPTAGAVDKTSGTVRFDKANSTDHTSLANPIPVKTSGQSYSYARILQTYIASGTFTQISGLEMYSDGANNFGDVTRKMWITPVAQSGSYTQPEIPNESQDPPQFPSGTNMVDWFGFTSASPFDLGTGPYDISGVPKYIGNYMKMVFEVEANGPSGITPSESLTVRWQEIA